MGNVFNMTGGGAGAGIKLASIAITTPPTQTAYRPGQTFNPAGMEVTATYSNGATLVASRWTYSPSGALTEGLTSVTVIYTEGGVTAQATQPITVQKATSHVPTQSGTLTYSGSAQAPSWSNYDPTEMTLGGVTSATDAGSYNATFTLLDTVGTQWSDGTTAPKTVAWTIGQAQGSVTLDPSSLSITSSNPTQSVTVTRLGTGTITAQSQNTGTATVSVSGNVVSVTGESNGSTTVIISVAADNNYTAASATLSVEVTLINVFGCVWDSTQAAPELTRLTPQTDPNAFVTTAVSGEPSPAVGTGTGSSPFDTVYPWSNMVEYNVIDGAISYPYGDPQFSRTQYNTVVYIPDFYYKVVDSDGLWYFYLSDSSIEGFTKHPGGGRYIGRYPCVSGYKSVSGDMPINNQTSSSYRSGISSLGAGWYSVDYATFEAARYLFLIEFASWNGAEYLGRGITANSGVETGATDAMIYHTGTISSGAYIAMQYRGIEAFWGAPSFFIDGLNVNWDNSQNVAMFYLGQDVTQYADATDQNYISVGSVSTSALTGLYVKLPVSPSPDAPWVFVPADLGGSGTTYTASVFSRSTTGWQNAFSAGTMGSSGNNVYNLGIQNLAQYPNQYVGARPMFISNG